MSTEIAAFPGDVQRLLAGATLVEEPSGMSEAELLSVEFEGRRASTSRSRTVAPPQT